MTLRCRMLRLTSQSYWPSHSKTEMKFLPFLVPSLCYCCDPGECFKNHRSKKKKEITYLVFSKVSPTYFFYSPRYFCFCLEFHCYGRHDFCQESVPLFQSRPPKSQPKPCTILNSKQKKVQMQIHLPKIDLLLWGHKSLGYRCVLWPSAFLELSTVAWVIQRIFGACCSCANVLWIKGKI